MPSFLIEEVKKSGRLVASIKILDDNHQPVGNAELSLINPNTARLDDIYIYRAHRGNSYGVELLKKTLEEARRQGATILRCHPSPYEYGPNELKDKRTLPSRTPQAKLITWYVAQGFKELNLKLEQDRDEFERYSCKLYIMLNSTT